MVLVVAGSHGPGDTDAEEHVYGVGARHVADGGVSVRVLLRRHLRRERVWGPGRVRRVRALRVIRCYNTNQNISPHKNYCHREVLDIIFSYLNHSEMHFEFRIKEFITDIRDLGHGNNQSYHKFQVNGNERILRTLSRELIEIKGTQKNQNCIMNISKLETEAVRKKSVYH